MAAVAGGDEMMASDRMVTPTAARNLSERLVLDHETLTAPTSQ